jgi:hypothetical protein
MATFVLGNASPQNPNSRLHWESAERRFAML